MSEPRVPWFWIGFAATIVIGVVAVKLATRPAAPLPVVSARVIKRIPHDASAYTQGLVFADGRLFESTGKRGHSTLREVELETGRVLRAHRLDDSLFGEGLAAVGDQLVQLTWRAGRALVYDRDTFEPAREFAYPGEGWGLAFNGSELVLSDGTSQLRGLDPKTFEERWRRTVTAGGHPLARLNELEFVGHELWANVFEHDVIARIRLADGVVTGWIDASGLTREARATSGVEVLNGIAYDPLSGRVFLTGKNWPTLFEIERPTR